MAKIIIYNVNTQALEIFYRGENETMPYTYGTTMNSADQVHQAFYGPPPQQWKAGMLQDVLLMLLFLFVMHSNVFGKAVMDSSLSIMPVWHLTAVRRSAAAKETDYGEQPIIWESGLMLNRRA